MLLSLFQCTFTAQAGFYRYFSNYIVYNLTSGKKMMFNVISQGSTTV